MHVGTTRAVIAALGMTLASCTPRGGQVGDAPAAAGASVVYVTDDRDTFALQHRDSSVIFRSRPLSSPELLARLSGAESAIVRDSALAAALSGSFTASPLPWDRTWVLVRRSEPDIPLSEGLVIDLARASSFESSRAAAPPFPWEGRTGCTGPQPPPPRLDTHIVYPARDSTAALLAARLAALSGRTVRALDQRELEYALADGRAAAALVDFVRSPAAEWPVPAIFCGAVITPLLDTHAWLVQRVSP